MKTTVDLPETLLAEIRALAERRGLTVRAVFEESLRAFVQQEESRPKSKTFGLAHRVVKGSKFPSMRFAKMLKATAPDRMPE